MRKSRAEKIQEEIKKYIAQKFYKTEMTATGGSIYRDPFNDDTCVSTDECFDRIFTTKEYGIPRKKGKQLELDEEDMVSISG
jgi:hypothetical protein